MNKGLITQLLKTPSQIRAEEQEALRQKGLQRAALVRGSGGAGASVFGGMFRDFAAQQAAEVDKRTQQVIQGLGGAAGLDMRSADEKLAVQRQQQMRLVQSADNLTRMKAVKGRLEAQGADPQIMAMLNQRMAAEEQAISAKAQQAFQRDQATQQLSMQTEQLEIAREKANREGVQFEALQDFGEEMAAGEYDFSTKEGRAAAARQLITAGEVGEAIKLVSIGTDPVDYPEMTQNIRNLATMALACDPNDPVCFNQAREMYTQIKRKPVSETVILGQIEDINERRDKLRKGAGRIINNSRIALTRMEEGDVIMGTLGPARQIIERLLVETGMSRDDALTRTTSVMTTLQMLATDLLGSGVYGSGTGLSDNDAKRAAELFAASGEVTPEEAKEILNLHMRIERAKIVSYNNEIMDRERYPDSFFDTAGRTRESFLMDVPPVYIGPVEDGWRTFDGDDGNSYYYDPYSDSVYNRATGDLIEGEFTVGESE